MILAGVAAGAVNGLFGAGGGMILIPLLDLAADTNTNDVFASSLAIILPISAVSIIINCFTHTVDFVQALPYLIGSGLGGTASGLLARKIPGKWLHCGLGLLIIWGGIRFIC